MITPGHCRVLPKGTAPISVGVNECRGVAHVAAVRPYMGW